MRATRWLAVTLALLAGCSKAREPARTAPQVPVDAAVVVTLSVDKLRAGEQWSKLEAALASKLPLADVKKLCATDPITSIESLTISIPEDLAPDRAAVVVRGVARDVADSCAKAFAARENQMITVGDEAGVSAYRQGEEAVFVSWLDGKTLMAMPGALTSKDPLLALGKPGVPRDPILADAFAQLRGSHVLELAFSAPPQSALAGFLAQSGIEPESGYGWLDLGSTLRAELVLRFATPERAASAAAQTPSGPLAKLVAKQRDREVTFSLALDATETTQLIDQLVTMTK